jgi:hypothetical protein
MTTKSKRVLIVAGSIAGLALGGAGIAKAIGGDDEGKPITGDALQRASKVALDRTGGGRVTGTELRDEEGYYEVEVTRSDGSEVDVHLDRGFKVIDGPTADSSGDGRDARGN